MKVKQLAVLGSTLLVLASAYAEPHAQWSYEGETGPNHWAKLDGSFMTCKTGKAQSPIDIETKKVKKANLKPIDFAYQSSQAEVVNNGYTIQVNLPEAGSATIAGKEYRLLQFHFHTPSEEMVDGKAYPLVAHLVHMSGEGKLAVVGVLFKKGQENQALKPIFNNLPAKEGGKKVLENKFNASMLLPPDRKYYAFMGSLTTPPCTEQVSWQILKAPVEISSSQLEAFQKLYKMNARPVQPLHGRVVQGN